MISIQILCDNEDSWINEYIDEFVRSYQSEYLSLKFVHDANDVERGDILFMLGCERRFEYLDRNEFNLVVHESKLPEGKGWSPLTWQVLTGSDEITVTLFEAVTSIDAGDVYLTKKLFLDGNELVTELREKQWKCTRDLILEFLDYYPNIQAKPQIGDSTYFPKRTPLDSELDIYETLDRQFNLLRVVDNERYPAFFYRNGVKYLIKIIKE